LELLYQPDTHQRAKENVLDLLEFLAQESEGFKEYVYQILKRFAEKSHKRFLQTNIVDFMNKLARDRRRSSEGKDSIEDINPVIQIE